MNEKTEISVDKEIAVEACAWFAQLETGDMTAADVSALREWMARSPAHAREIREIARLSGELTVLTQLAGPLATVSGADSPLRRRRFGAGRAGAMLAAAAVLAVGAVIATLALRPGETGPAVYQTGVGEYDTVVLPDGSEVRLNTDTLVDVSFEADERRVRLVYGEALFDVRRNERRPFRVYSGQSVAEAVGTSFVVRLKGAVTELAVVEGLVAFSKLPAGGSAAPRTEPGSERTTAGGTASSPTRKVLVRAGEGVTSDDIALAAAPTGRQTAVSSITEGEIRRRLSWTEGLLEFSQAPLDEVVAEVSRHIDVSIVIADPGLESLTFGGIFRTGDVDHLIEALEPLGVRAERYGDDEIRLYSAAAE